MQTRASSHGSTSMAALTTPDAVVWITGARAEQDELLRQMVDAGTLIQLNPEHRPYSFLARSDPDDVARVESRTFICSESEADAGPSNNWAEPAEMRDDPARTVRRFDARPHDVCRPVLDGTPRQSALALRRAGHRLAVRRREHGHHDPHGFGGARAHHARHRVGARRAQVGAPLGGRARWMSRGHAIPTKYICALPGDPRDLVVRFGIRRQRHPGQEGLRPAHRERDRPRRGLAGRAHAAAQGDQPARPGRSTSPRRSRARAARPTSPCCARPCRDGPSRPSATTSRGSRREPTAGCAPSTPRPGSSASRPAPAPRPTPQRSRRMWGNTIFTNVALRDDGDIWWEGLTQSPPDHLVDWTGQDWTPASGTPAAHPNSRFTVSAAQCPSISDDWDDPRGVVIDAIIFGGRRATNVPLVAEARDWEHGVFLGATISSERTAAAEGTVGELRRDPFAMLPFCGYNMADHWGHWLSVGRAAACDRRSAARSSRSTGSARATTARTCGRASVTTAACWRGSWIGSRAGRPPSRARWAGCPRRDPSSSRAPA